MTSVKAVTNFDKQVLFAFVLTVMGAIMFSAKGLFIKFAYQYQVDTVTLLAIRMAISVPIYLVIGFYSERFHHQRISTLQLMAISVFGFIGYYLASYLDMHGLHYISVSLERVLLYLYPTFVLLLSAVILKQRITRGEVISLLLAYFGIVIIFSENININMDRTYLGAALVAVSALAFAVFMIGSDKHIKLVGSVRFTAYAMSAAGCSIFIHYLLSDRVGIMQQHQDVYFWGGVLAIISTIIPSFLMAHGMKVLGAKKVSMLGVIGPVSTLLLGVFFLDEALTIMQVLGVAIVISAVSFIVFINKVDKDKQ